MPVRKKVIDQFTPNLWVILSEDLYIPGREGSWKLSFTSVSHHMSRNTLV